MLFTLLRKLIPFWFVLSRPCGGFTELLHLTLFLLFFVLFFFGWLCGFDRITADDGTAQLEDSDASLIPSFVELAHENVRD